MMHRWIRDHRVRRVRGNLGPRLWQQGAHRQGGLPEQRNQNRDPAAPKDTHQAQAGGPALAALVAQSRGHIEQRARGDRLLSGPTDAEQPQGATATARHSRAARSAGSCGYAATASPRV